jgi:sterol desaturase/sphingolipid hydroxylase (fatty acid hydroxylase superfamily)
MDWFFQAFDIRGLFVTVLIFVPFERMLAKNPRQKIFRREWQTDITYLFVNRLFVGVGLSLVVVLVVLAGPLLVPENFRLAVARQSNWVQVAELILLSDLIFYGVHRLFHAVPYLWRFHAVHHSIEQMDWLAAHRIHPVDQILTKGASLVPCFLMGFSNAAIVAFFLLFRWHTILLHANARITFGPIRWLVASPNFHHWHHSKEPEAWDKNFASQLAMLDILFGTAYMPAKKWTPSYGLDEAVPRTYARQILYPFRKPIRQSVATAEIDADDALFELAGASADRFANIDAMTDHVLAGGELGATPSRR